MKKLIFTNIMALAVVVVLAQPGPPSKHSEKANPEKMATAMTEKMTTTLDLTEAQAAEVFKINLDFATQMKQGEASRKVLHQKHLETLETVLTPDQMKELEDQIADRKKMHRHKGHEREADREEMRKE